MYWVLTRIFIVVLFYFLIKIKSTQQKITHHEVNNPMTSNTFTVLCKPPLSSLKMFFIIPKTPRPLNSDSPSSSCASSWQSQNCFLSLKIYLFCVFHISEIWLFSLRIFSRFTHITACFFMTEWYFTICINHNLFIHLSIVRHLGCSQFGAVVNSAVKKVWAQEFFWVPVFNILGYVSRSGIAGLHGNSV